MVPTAREAIDVLVVVVTYNGEDIIGDLLRSLPAGLDGCAWSLVIADNASRDSTISIVRSITPQASVVEMGRNAGYAAGINAAVAAGEPAGSVLILNQDTRLEPGSVRAMLRRLDRVKVGIVVPRLLNSRHALVQTLRREPNVRRSIGDMVLTAQRAGRYPMWGERVIDPHCYSTESSADWAAGTAMLLSRDCLDECGGWDESFFLYSEETEFCLRARDHGFELVLAPDAEVVHLGGESRISSSLRALLVVNRVILYRRRHRLSSGAMFWLVAVLRESSRLVLRRAASRQAVIALLNPRRARTLAIAAASQLPDVERRRRLARIADSVSAHVEQ